MSDKSLNMYQQIVDMELHDLENKVIDLQNLVISYSAILDEMWAYHPANPNFINPIKGYDEMKKTISGIENQINDLELKIQTLKSTN
jgi:hypothetical protein